MARKLRVEFPGAVYHVVSRGDHQEAIYRDDDHYFETVSTYIHSNPVCSGLISAKPGALAGFRWSSFPECLKCLRKRRPWLGVARVLGSLASRLALLAAISLTAWVTRVSCLFGCSSRRGEALTFFLSKFVRRGRF